MKRFIYIPLIILVSWAANEVYVSSGLYLRDIHKCSAELLLTMDSLIHKKNIIYFGESSNFTFAENDSCKKSISELISDLNPNYKILTLSKGAIHAATYEQLVKRVKDNSEIKTIIISLNLRSFGINWIQSSLESNLSRANVLYSNYPPVIKKMMLSLKIYDNKDEFKRKEIIKWHYKHDKFKLKNKNLTNVRDWDALVFDKGIPNENGIKDQFKTDVACHFIKNYAFVLNESNPRIMNLDNIIKFCNEKNIKLIFNLLPENYQKAENLCGEDLKLLMQENVNFLKSRYQTKTTFIDNFSLLADSCFIDKNWPTEHYIYFGRKLLAERLNEKLRN